MKNLKALFPIALLLGFAAWFLWAIYTPKEDVSRRIYKTLKEQQTRADLSFKKVSFEEVAAGEKFWQLQAETAIVNRDTGVAALQNTRGTFYKAGRPVLKFRSPAALWDMKRKEIYLDKPLGYDVAYERRIASLVESLRARPLSVFNLSQVYQQGLGYWFQARNLSWRLSDQLLFCTGGIVLNKGEVTAFAENLKGDVEFKKVELGGQPKAEIRPAHDAPITFEAETFELSRPRDTLIARGRPRISWREARLDAATARYFQAEKKLELKENVRITYRDIAAAGSAASYFTERQEVLLTGNATAVQGENRLSSDRVMVSLRDQKISLVGKSRVVISGEKIKK